MLILRLLPPMLGVVGSWLIGWSLKVRLGMDPDLRKEIDDPNLLVPSEVTLSKKLLWWGLALVTLAGAIQVGQILSDP